MVARRVVGVLLGLSVVGGVAAGVVADRLTSSSPRGPAGGSAAAAATPYTPPPPVEVKKPVLVANRDGGATLSATLVNHTAAALDVVSGSGGRGGDSEAPAMLIYRDPDTQLLPERPTTVGDAGTGYLMRFTTPVQVGSTLPITLTLGAGDGPSIDPISITFSTPVVGRGPEHAGVGGDGENRSIRVNDPMIVVVPEQEKAFVGGYITSTIEDTTFELPTAIDEKGAAVTYRHQTATGGPFGIFAMPGQKTYFRPVAVNAPPRSPFLDDGVPGTADYFRASDLTIGENITVTMRFPSGDVVTEFPVVQGKADGTL